MSENSASAVESQLSQDAQILMAAVRDHYLRESGEFNGLRVTKEDEHLRSFIEELFRAGMIQIVTPEDYLSPNFLPWPSKRPVEDQLSDIQNLDKDQYGFCLYPTTFAMKDVSLPERFEGRPFEIAMARGKGALELAYFDFDVLERYRNDSKFILEFGDNSASISVNEKEIHYIPERELIELDYIGYAYNLSEYDPDDPSTHLTRAVVLMYTDLLKLSPLLQKRWETHQIDPEGLEPHPIWWNRQMGEWDTDMGPFDRLFVELANINELSMIAFEANIFRSTKRPDGFGWIVRPSHKEWESFIHLMDKIISDNLIDDFFDKVEAPKKKNGEILGTLKRFPLFLEAGGANEPLLAKIFEPLFRIRKLRQSPAHEIAENFTDLTFIRQQVDLVREVNVSMALIRWCLSRHPACVNWENKWDKYGDSLI